MSTNNDPIVDERPKVTSIRIRPRGTVKDNEKCKEISLYEVMFCTSNTYNSYEESLETIHINFEVTGNSVDLPNKFSRLELSDECYNTGFMFKAFSTPHTIFNFIKYLYDNSELSLTIIYDNDHDYPVTFEVVREDCKPL